MCAALYRIDAELETPTLEPPTRGRPGDLLLVRIGRFEEGAPFVRLIAPVRRPRAGARHLRCVRVSGVRLRRAGWSCRGLTFGLSSSGTAARACSRPGLTRQAASNPSLEPLESAVVVWVDGCDLPPSNALGAGRDRGGALPDPSYEPDLHYPSSY
jgi:hypothetical protein